MSQLPNLSQSQAIQAKLNDYPNQQLTEQQCDYLSQILGWGGDHSQSGPDIFQSWVWTVVKNNYYLQMLADYIATLIG